MKKLLFSAFLIGAMSSNLMAIDGTVSSITAKDDGSIRVDVTDAGSHVTSKALAGTTDAIKAMLAIALTAKTTNSDVTVYGGTAGNGTVGWKTIIIK